MRLFFIGVTEVKLAEPFVRNIFFLIF